MVARERHLLIFYWRLAKIFGKIPRFEKRLATMLSPTPFLFDIERRREAPPPPSPDLQISALRGRQLIAGKKFVFPLSAAMG